MSVPFVWCLVAALSLHLVTTKSWTRFYKTIDVNFLKNNGALQVTIDAVTTCLTFALTRTSNKGICYNPKKKFCRLFSNYYPADITGQEYPNWQCFSELLKYVLLIYLLSNYILLF